MPVQIPAISGAPTPKTQASGNPKATLGKDDFLKLFVAQITHQDPSKPMDDTAFMGQMAQFSTLEQISNMAQQNTRVADSLAQSGSISLIGRTVNYVNEAGETQSGVVEKVTTAGGRSVLTVGGVENIDPATVSAVS
jgi:flagellar basal-body rod modification protein FlgD